VCILLFVVTVPITFGISWITYKFIEEPMIELGSRLASSVASRRHR
jgi:peptidoglycan/LPS O-acetylase OafA/YrhL